MRSLRGDVPPAPLPPVPEGCRLTPEDADALELGPLLGEGGRSAVHAARFRGRDVAVKVYKPRAIARHARKHALPVAEFEFRRNLAFHRAPGLAPYVAEPFAFAPGPGRSLLVQERLDGRLYYFHHRDGRGGVEEPGFADHLARLLGLAHAAGLYDVDLHAMNVMAARGPDGSVRPMIFDFNLIPFHVRPPNPVVGFLLRTGLMGLAARDLRKLRAFHDFRRVERKLLGFYEGARRGPSGEPPP